MLASFLSAYKIYVCVHRLDRYRHFCNKSFILSLSLQADQLETKKSTLRRLRERSTHYAKKMIEVEQTADCCISSLTFLHRGEKYKPTALELDLQRRRSVVSEENSNALCVKLEDLQHRVGFLVETLFPEVQHPRGGDVDEENTSEIDPDNARVCVFQVTADE